MRVCRAVSNSGKRMKTNLVRLTLVVIISCAVSMAAQGQVSEAPLTNAAVVKLVRAGFKEKTVIAIIHNRPNRFNLDPDRLIELKRSGVSENIILAMLAQNESFVFADDDWTNDSRSREEAGLAMGSKRTVRMFRHFWKQQRLQKSERRARNEMGQIRGDYDDGKRYGSNSASPSGGRRCFAETGEDAHPNQRLRDQVS